MAYAKIVFMKENLDTKSLSWWGKRLHMKIAPVGFSWSALFLGLLIAWGVPAGRGDLKWAAIMFLCEIPGVYGLSVLIQSIIGDFSAFTQNIAIFMVLLTIFWILSFPFFYNKIYIKGLIKKGFKAESLHSAYPSAGIDSLDSLLDSLSTKWNMEIPRLETENDGEETRVG